jgi:hypothetical protein
MVGRVRPSLNVTREAAKWIDEARVTWPRFQVDFLDLAPLAPFLYARLCPSMPPVTVPGPFDLTVPVFCPNFPLRTINFFTAGFPFFHVCAKFLDC